MLVMLVTLWATINESAAIHTLLHLFCLLTCITLAHYILWKTSGAKLPTPAAKRQATRAKSTGAWITAMPDTLNGTVLLSEEFRDSLKLRYGLQPTALPTRCDGCSKNFSVEHAMSCKAGELVLLRHNEVAGEWHRLCAQAPLRVVEQPVPKVNTPALRVEMPAPANTPAPVERVPPLRVAEQPVPISPNITHHTIRKFVHSISTLMRATTTTTSNA